MKQRRAKLEATRPMGSEGYALTGATDESGIPVPLSNFDIERMPRPEIDAYREKREWMIEERKAEAREADDFERYRERFTQAGGSPKDAKQAWQEKKRTDAAEEAVRYEAEVLAAGRRRIRQGL